MLNNIDQAHTWSSLYLSGVLFIQLTVTAQGLGIVVGTLQSKTNLISNMTFQGLVASGY